MEQILGRKMKLKLHLITLINLVQRRGYFRLNCHQILNITSRGKKTGYSKGDRYGQTQGETESLSARVYQ